VKLAILAPVHGSNADRVRAQLENYALFLGNGVDCRFYLHVSRESTDGLRDELSSFSASFPFDIYIAHNSRQTSIMTCLNALVELAQVLGQDMWDPDYVLWHSESDLLVRDGVCSEICKYDFGIGIHHINYFDDKWSHAPKMRLDYRLGNLLDDTFEGSVSNLRIGRVEGCFMNSYTWSFVTSKIFKYFDNSFFDDLSNHWCAEEILLPSLARIANTQSLRYRDQLIYTKDTLPNANRDPGLDCISISDILKIRKEGIYFGAKWFSPDLSNETRLFLKRVT
jgi:hypothetical protein